jgi:hypothetical protein
MSRLSQPAQSVEQQKKQAFVTGLFIVNHQYLKEIDYELFFI